MSGMTVVGVAAACRRGRMHSDDPLFGKGKWQHDGFEALNKEQEANPVGMMW